MDTMTVETERPARRERGSGSIFKPEYRDRKTGELRKARFFWIQYRVNSRPVRENTHSEKITVAKHLLQRRIGEIHVGAWVGPKTQKTTIADIVEAVFRDYRINGLKSVRLAEHRWRKHLEPFFGNLRAVEVTSDSLSKYIDERRAAGGANATINREMALLRRAFNIAYHANPRKVHEVPSFPMLKENDARSGFVTYEEYAELCRNCREPWLRALIGAGFNFGFRVNELLTLRVRQVDLLAHSITLDAGTTKNRKPRTVPMTSEVYKLLCSCIVGKQPSDFVFTRSNGKPVGDYRWDWYRLCVRSGLGKLTCSRCSSTVTDEDARRCERCHVLLRYSGKIFHDFRRSAVRNMTRSGVPRSDAMKISGHRTESIFARYDIGNDADLVEAARRIEARQKEAFSLVQTCTKQSQSEQILAN